MQVLIVEHAPASLKGELRRYLYELSPNTYAGNVPRTVSDAVWKKVTGTIGVTAVMVTPSANGQGYSVRTAGDPSESIGHIEDLYLSVTAKALRADDFLAKSDTRKDLRCHLAETAVMMRMLCETGILRNTVGVLSEKLKTPRENVVKMLCFIASVHDVGKVFPGFQKNAGNAVFERYPEGIRFRHEVLGANFINDWMRDKGLSASTTGLVTNAVYMHHQGYKDNGHVTWEDPQDECIIRDIASGLINDAWELFGFEEPENPGRDLNGVNTLIEGSLIISDWAASSAGVYDEMRPDDFRCAEDYIAHLEKQAGSFIIGNRMRAELYNTASVDPATAFRNLFGISKPRPMQETIIKILSESDRNLPTFCLIEDLCGGGKTEAAELASYIFSDGKQGIYMAMPTSATAEAMHGRFRKFINKSKGKEDKVPLYSSKTWLKEDNLGPDRKLWLSDTRTKLLYPSAIGTIDQVLAYAHLLKYGQIGLAALVGKTLIIDEIHDYDDYMLEAIYELLRFCGWAGISVTACSATLSDKTKRKLFNAYIDKNENTELTVNGTQVTKKRYPTASGYPLITMVRITGEDKAAITETGCKAYSAKRYKYKLVKVLGEGYAQKIAELAKKQTEHGGCLSVIMNTVAEADEVYEAICAACPETPVILYYAQMTEEWKSAVASDILYKFGLEGKANGDRPKKAIVVSTSILQQSMDVDFDFMFTELCPGDVLIQRFGRERRHGDEGTIRELMSIDTPILILCSPTVGPKSQENRVYGRSDSERMREAVERTYAYLNRNGKDAIDTPDELREFINSVYPDEAMRNSADSYKAVNLIGNPRNGNHPFRTLAEKSALPAHAETRLSSETVNIMIVPESVAKRIREEGDRMPEAEIRKTVRKYAVHNVYYGKIEPFEDSPQRSDVDLQGRLSDYMIFVSDDGAVYADKRKMLLDETGRLQIK